MSKFAQKTRYSKSRLIEIKLSH